VYVWAFDGFIRIVNNMLNADETSTRKDPPHFPYPYNPLLPLLSIPSPLSSSISPVLTESDISVALDISDNLFNASSSSPSSSSRREKTNQEVANPYGRNVPKEFTKSLIEKAPSSVFSPFPQTELLQPSFCSARLLFPLYFCSCVCNISR
jgi:hypothetical protein